MLENVGGKGWWNVRKYGKKLYRASQLLKIPLMNLHNIFCALVVLTACENIKRLPQKIMIISIPYLLL